MKCCWLISLLLCTTALLAQIAIPTGTILPLELDSSLNSKKSRAGQVITARITQDVPLPSGFKIRARSKLSGHIIAVTPASQSSGAKLSFQFDRLQAGGQQLSLIANLRSLASMMEVHEAQLPESGPDRGIAETAWITHQIGGEINYHGGWPVTNGSEIVGRSVLSGGVLVTVRSNPGGGCPGEIGDDLPQALWVFASDACGTYGFADLSIAHAGRTEPMGQIVLASEKGNINVPGGSGLLLRVIAIGR